MLPIEFLHRMEKMLGEEEFSSYLASYDTEKYQGLRVNPLKGSSQELKEKTGWELSAVPWAKEGYYYQSNLQPGKHPYHAAGVYYIQEPSAMAPAHYLDAQPAERILDLCAAPGGKSTQIAGAMQGQGLLVCNEIHPARAKILSENVERMGIRNAIVTNESPTHLAEKFHGYFDRIMVDAPCSGEGMFRKNEQACEEWSPENVAICADRQDEILEAAHEMLKPGGRMVYSTCTFAPEEDEGSISRFIHRHPGYEIVPVSMTEGMSSGRAEWTDDPAENMERTIRLFPHKIHGEGHYLAVLKKGSADPSVCEGSVSGGLEKGISEKECKEYLEFEQEFLQKNIHEQGIFVRFGEQLYLAPEDTFSLKGLKVLRPGLHLGTVKKNRFEPSHALALALKPEQAKNVTNLPAASYEASAYLKGQTLNTDGKKGWHLITVDGYSLGWGKLAGGVLKNHYPKGLRIQG
ncbi:MAG: RsmF rRNA methyltransferase first C-terminal domain-containing protein [Lachnospiraceae bacterium]|nr:RsmF rRNA methyltransferase first C-terminal domain-containing protein [Lachnospiraceae bacterium]